MIKLQAGEFIGSYRIRNFIARGGFAFVYKALDVHGNWVALKIGDVAGGGRYVTRFLDVTDRKSEEGVSPDECPGEAIFFRKSGACVDFLDADEIDALILSEWDLLRRTKNPHLIGVREQFKHEGREVLVMDFAGGETLRERIRELKGIHFSWFLAIVRMLRKVARCGVMTYHGDLKPENIIVRRGGSIVVVDPAMRSIENSPVGIITTTPHYNPLLLTDQRADVMAIGIMLYEILTGVLPFDEVPWKYAGCEMGGEVERLSLSYFLSYTLPSDLNPNTPEFLEKIIYRCLTIPNYGLKGLEEDIVKFLREI